jgi:nucleotide-binding universal stress UspA family protein
MSRTILVPLDGSQFAEHALPTAIAIARRTGAALELITVDRAPVSWVVPEVPIVMDEVLPVQDGQRYLEELHARMPADVPVRLTTLQGRAAPFLVRHIGQSEPALVVMSTHGRGGFSRLWLGSVADGVARQSPAPFLMVKPPEMPVDLNAKKQFPRVLIPLDGSVAGEEILDQALVTFGVEGVQYTLMRVISPLAVEPPPVRESTPARRSESRPEALLHAAADRMRSRGATVLERLSVSDSPTTAIADVAGEIGARVIAMTTHARRGMSRFLLGSVADKVLRTAPCPVMLYHPTHEVVDVRRRVETARASAVPL